MGFSLSLLENRRRICKDGNNQRRPSRLLNIFCIYRRTISMILLQFDGFSGNKLLLFEDLESESPASVRIHCKTGAVFVLFKGTIICSWIECECRVRKKKMNIFWTGSNRNLLWRIDVIFPIHVLIWWNTCLWCTRICLFVQSRLILLDSSINACFNAFV